MRGYRKLIIALLAIIGAFYVPIGEYQAKVIIAVACTAIGGNAAIGSVKTIVETLGRRHNRRVDPGSGDPGDAQTGQFSERHGRPDER